MTTKMNDKRPHWAYWGSFLLLFIAIVADVATFQVANPTKDHFAYHAAHSSPADAVFRWLAWVGIIGQVAYWVLFSKESKFGGDKAIVNMGGLAIAALFIILIALV